MENIHITYRTIKPTIYNTQMIIDNTHCTETDVKHNMLILTLFLVVSQGIVDEGLVSFCSSKRDRVFSGVT